MVRRANAEISKNEERITPRWVKVNAEGRAIPESVVEQGK
jgi:hypothetical protein